MLYSNFAKVLIFYLNFFLRTSLVIIPLKSRPPVVHTKSGPRESVHHIKALIYMNVDVFAVKCLLRSTTAPSVGLEYVASKEKYEKIDNLTKTFFGRNVCTVQLTLFV